MDTDAAHRQTRYEAAEPLPGPEVLPLPHATDSAQQALEDLRDYGLCILRGALDEAQIEALSQKLDHQARAEQALGDANPGAVTEGKQVISSLVNKGKAFLDLVERDETDRLAGFMLGKDFLISSLTGHLFHGPTREPQPLHRDQGQVPATVDFPAACNLFWLLDDFTPERGSTFVVPGSHRWPAEHQVAPPDRSQAVQITAPAGSIFAWDGRIWHGTGVNREGHPRRNVAAFLCLPWMRQQENWGVTCLQEVLDEASPKLRVRLGLRTYGTLGMMTGAYTSKPAPASSLGNYDVTIPDYVIGENAELHPVRRVSRKER